MIIKNLTFVVPVRYESVFLAQAVALAGPLGAVVNEVKAYRLLEQLDPDTYNFAMQLSFDSQIRLDTFNKEWLTGMIDELQSGVPAQILYFESHLERIF